MLTEQEALAIFRKKFRSAVPQKIIALDEIYVILAPRSDDPVEGEMDPFYSVDMRTGATRDYSILAGGRAIEIDSLFQNAPII